MNGGMCGIKDEDCEAAWGGGAAASGGIGGLSSAPGRLQ